MQILFIVFMTMLCLNGCSIGYSHMSSGQPTIENSITFGAAK